MKKRILLCNDASFLNTGYGIYGKEILSRLHNSGKFDVAELACYADVEVLKNKDIPWKVYANAVSMKDERISSYKSSNINQFGAWRFNRVVADFRPNIVFDIRDYWMYSYQEISPYRKYFNWIIMPTVDSAPQKKEWKITFSNADTIIPYTEWAKNTLTEECGKTINLYDRIAYAGINDYEFYPIPKEEKHQLKINYFGSDVKVIGTVMRNQRRKLLADLLLVFRKYLDKDPSNRNTILYLHTSYPEENGWDIPTLLLEYGVSDKVYFTYHCSQCKESFPLKFQGSATICKKCGKFGAHFVSPTNGIETSSLNRIYNLFDIYIQYAICEGFGMPQIEAACCGVPIAAVDYSAMSEIVKYLDGFPIPYSLFREMETNALRALPDNNYMVDMLHKFFNEISPEFKTKYQTTMRKKCIDRYSWDNVYSVWESCFDKVDITKKRDWDATDIDVTQQGSTTVPNNLSKKEFIEFICLEVIKEPYLLNTAPINTLLKDFYDGLGNFNGGMKIIDHQHVVNILESFISNKNMCEQMRLNKNTIVKEDFIP